MSQPPPRPAMPPRPPHLWEGSPSAHPSHHPIAPGEFGPPPSPPPEFGPPPTGSPGPGGSTGPARGRRRTVALVLAALLVVAGLGAGGWALFGPSSAGDDEAAERPPHRTRTELAWSEDAEAPDEGVLDTPGTWFTDAHAVKAQPERVVALGLADGERDWSLPLDGTLCGTSLESVAGRAAVQHGPGCTELTLLDLDKGRELWTRRLSDPFDPGRFEAGELAVTRNTVAISSVSGSAVYRISDRKKVYDDGGTADGCHPVGVRGGEALVARVQCGGANAGQVWGFDPETGERAWKWEAPRGLDIAKIVATSPAVVGMQTESSDGAEFLMRLGDEGREPVKMEMQRQNAYLCSNPTALCTDVVVGDGAVYVPGETHSSHGDGSATVNEVIAYDLETGKVKWSGEPEDKRELAPVATLDGDLIAYETATQEKGGALLRFDGETGERSVYERHPVATSERESDMADDAVPLLHQGMFFLAAEEIYGRDRGEEAKSLLAAFR
ncbi:outer membrane protein assembly factor BamB family protein [Streptomyces sp. NPDC054796]